MEEGKNGEKGDIYNMYMKQERNMQNVTILNRSRKTMLDKYAEAFSLKYEA